MDFNEIPDPIDGERTVAVVPTPAPLVDAAWARARMFTGRTVSATALDREQLQREGHVRLLARALRPGIAHGLRAEVELDEAGQRRRVLVEPGFGVCGSGDDVVVASTMNASVVVLGIEISRSLPVEGPDATQPTLADALAFWRDNGPAVPALPPDVPPPEDGGDIGAFGRLPLPAVLVLEPVVIDELPLQDDTDPCERDPEAEAFEDWRYVDGARLRWIPLTVWLDELGLDVGAWLASALGSRRTLDAYRNGLAHGLFDLEAAIDAHPPWQRGSVALALCAFDADGNVLFLDRSAAARRSGRRSASTPLPSEPALWQARIEQLAEHLLALGLTRDVPLASHLRRLPPAGVLPRALFDLAARRTRAFPTTWGISAAPVPLESLDAILRRAASLAPYDLDATSGDEVKVLVPVPASAWDPGLLQIATVHPDLHNAILHTHGSLRIIAERRAELHAKIAALYGALGGLAAIPPFTPDDDEAALVEQVIRSVLWDSDAAIGLVARVANAHGAAIFGDAASLLEATNALLRDGAAPPPTSGEVRLLADAFASAGPDGPVVVAPVVAKGLREPIAIPTDLLVPDRVLPDLTLPGRIVPAGRVVPRISTGSLRRAAAKAEAELFEGPGFELEGGWAIPELVTHDLDLAVVRDAMLYLVAGTLDTEALDRAVQLSRRNGVVVVAADLDPIAREDLGSLFARSKTRPPLVCLLRGATAEGRAMRVEDIAARLDGRRVGTSPPEYVVSTPCAAVAERDRTVLVATRRAAALPDVSARLREVAAELERATTESIRRELTARLQILRGTGAIVFVPDAIDSQTGLPRRARAERAAELVRGLQRAERTADTTAEELLEQAVGAAEGTYGTVALVSGLSVRLVEDLVSKLRGMTTPPAGLRVVSEPEVQVVASGGIAGLVGVLEEKLDRAEDVIDFGFMMVQSATFRAREHLLGRDAAQRMASSPLLPDLADIIHQNVEATQLQTFFDQIKQEKPSGGSGGVVPWFQHALLFAAPKNVIFAAAGGFASVDPTGGMTQPATGLPSLPPIPTTEPEPVPDPIRPPRDRPTLDMSARLPGVAVAGVAVQPPRLRTLAAGAAQPMLEAVSFATGPQTIDVLSTPTYSGGKSARTPSVAVAKIIAATKEMRAREPVGWSLRNSGVSKRIQDSRAVELRAEAFRLRGLIAQTIAGLDLNLEGVKFPGFLEPAVEGQLRKTVSLPLSPERLDQLLKGEHDLQTVDADPAALVSDALRSLETTAAMLRIVEGRVREVREAVLLCKRAQVHIERLILAAEEREPVLDQALDEARHDLSVAAALLAEEQERVDAVNARRAQVLERDVPFVVFHRAREVDTHDPLPVHDVEPVLMADPALEALHRPAPAAPAELREIVDLWREAPIRWLRGAHPLLWHLDAVRPLHAILGAGAVRAQAMFASEIAKPISLAGKRGLELASALVTMRRSVVLPLRQPAAALSSGAVERLTWKQAQDVARTTLSVGDLLGSRFVSPKVSASAASVIDGIYKVAAHLYAEVGLVAPHIRLAWSLRISEHDRPIDLSDPAVLPHWTDVGTTADDHPDPFRKREITSLIGWLFSQIELGHAEARALMNDVVRVSILLASHAPVGRIVSGHVIDPAPLAPGATIRVKIDPSLVRIGMTALVTASAVNDVRAVVEDLADGHVVARVLSVSQVGLVLASGESVRFVESDATALSDIDPALPASGAKARVQLVR